MRKLSNLRRALFSCPTIAALGILAHGVFNNNEAHAQEAPPTCASLGFTNPVYLAGSTAVQSVINAIGPKLATAATPVQLVYTSAGSCDGVNTIVGGLKLSSNASYWDASGTLGTCSLNAQAIDIGLADVFPTSCPDITADALAGIGDFGGPVQSMNFAVPAAASATSISASAAYLTIGLGATGGTDWPKPELYAFRNFQSGTETMIAKAINVPTSKWPAAADKGSAGNVVTALKTPTGPADQTIGILASNQTDDNRDTIKRLAFQGYDQTCAYYPDSSLSSKDKANVRDGTYAIWGPLHMLTKVDTGGVPTDPQAKALLDIMLDKAPVTGVDIVDLEITANTVPQCAMHVQRTSELGAPTAYVPDTSCSCYFDSKRGDASACTACTTETAATVCPAGHKACNHGYCEVK
jgi:ABC-type phosphate transport system substrate-binding protein